MVHGGRHRLDAGDADRRPAAAVGVDDPDDLSAEGQGAANGLLPTHAGAVRARYGPRVGRAHQAHVLDPGDLCDLVAHVLDPGHEQDGVALSRDDDRGLHDPVEVRPVGQIADVPRLRPLVDLRRGVDDYSRQVALDGEPPDSLDALLELRPRNLVRALVPHGISSLCGCRRAERPAVRPG